MKLTITKELCDRYEFGNGRKCPLFHAAKDAGIKVKDVGIFWLELKNWNVLRVRPGFSSFEYREVQDTGVPFVCEVD